MQAYKRYIFGFILIMMLASPVTRVLKSFTDFSIAPLKGYTEIAQKPEFSFSSFFDGSWQAAYDNYLEDHIGLRNIFVRLYNQIDYSLFRIAHAAVIVGKDHHLYEENYIKAYTGTDFLGDSAIKAKVHKIKSVQEYLRQKNTDLIVILAPGKASFFPGKIPDRYMKHDIGITNNEAYLSAFKENGINHIDFNSLFIEMKDTSSYPLYHRCGIHWSIYGAQLALDSIISYIETLRQIDMVDMQIAGFEVSEVPRQTDYDVGDALNLIFRIPYKPMAYPYDYSFIEEGKTKPGLLVVADSYYWTLYNMAPNRYLWGRNEFRFYNNMAFSPGKPSTELCDNNIEELSSFDVIMVIYTEANMTKFANGLFEQAFLSMKYRDRLETIKQNIRNTPEWLEQVAGKADKNNVSIEQMIRIDALWTLNETIKKENNNSINHSSDGI